MSLKGRVDKSDISPTAFHFFWNDSSAVLRHPPPHLPPTLPPAGHVVDMKFLLALSLPSRTVSRSTDFGSDEHGLGLRRVLRCEVGALDYVPAHDGAPTGPVFLVRGSGLSIICMLYCQQRPYIYCKLYIFW